MTEQEKTEIDTLANEVVRDIASNVLERVIKEKNISDLGTCGIDMTVPENILMVAMVIEGSGS
jgi:hypothetical protein